MIIPIATFGFGVFLFLVGLLAFVLAFILNFYWLFVTSLIIGAIGVFLIAFGVFLKLASLLFRA